MLNLSKDGNQEHRDKAEECDQKRRRHYRSVASSMHNLAMTYQDGGDWNEAKDLQEKVVKFFEDVLGADHIDTINSLSSVAAIYRSLGRFPEAAKLQERVVKVTTAKFGKHNYITLISMGNLAITYRR
jgi:tetratricopeptide (TPR) repeat protein